MDKEIVVAKKLKHMNRAEAKVFLISRGYGVPKIREDNDFQILPFPVVGYKFCIRVLQLGAGSKELLASAFLCHKEP